jgi:hypothetical protein
MAIFLLMAALTVWAAWRETKVDRVEQQRRLSDADPKLVPASRELLEHDLPGVTLTMSLPDVLEKRPRLKRREKQDKDGFKVFEEPLASKKSALYFFAGERGIGPLMRVQIASSVRGLEAIVARVQDMQKRLGEPNGVWDCPAIPGQQLATRRYNYRRGVATALDVYMLVNDEAAATYFVAATRQIASALKDAKCVETPASRAHSFPLALPPTTAERTEE